MASAVADTGSLIDGPVRTIVLVIGGFACAAFALAWLLCRAAAIADRVEPGRDESASCDEPPWLDCQGRHGYARQPGGAWRCLICDEPQASTEVYDAGALWPLDARNPADSPSGELPGPLPQASAWDVPTVHHDVAIERLHADIAAFERGEQ